MIDIEVIGHAQAPQVDDRPPVPGFSGWFDAADASTLVAVAGGKVATWRDKGPGRYDQSQGTDANRPYTGGVSQAGRNVVSSRNSTTYLAGNQPGLTGYPWSVFLVACSTTADGTQRDPVVVHNGGIEWGRIYRPTNDSIAIYCNGGFSSSQTWQNGRPRLVSAVFNAGASRISVDGRYATTGTTGTIGSSPGMVILGYALSESWYGWIGELLFYPRLLTTGEGERTESYLRQKWGLS